MSSNDSSLFYFLQVMKSVSAAFLNVCAILVRCFALNIQRIIQPDCFPAYTILKMKL
jgi:hypothetical protein